MDQEDKQAVDKMPIDEGEEEVNCNNEGEGVEVEERLN